MKDKTFKILQIIGSIVAVIISIWMLVEILPPPHSESEIPSLREVQGALELYNIHYKYYPDNLQLLIQEGYLPEKGDLDKWGHKFKYKAIFDKNSEGAAVNYLLGSIGPDGKENTEDDVEPPIHTDKHTFKQKPSIATPPGVEVE